MKPIGAGILYTDGKQVLLIRRAEDAPHKLTWDFPGGRIDDGEKDPQKAAERESEEEVGVCKGKMVKEFKDRFYVYVYSVTKPFRVKLSPEHDKAEWVDIDKVSDMDLHPGVKKHWHKYLKFIKNLQYSFAEWVSQR